MPLQDIPQIYLDLVSILRAGRKQATTSTEIQQQLSIIDREHDTNPFVRDLVRDAILKFHFPIGSCPNGYYLISTDFEFLTTVNGLKNRVAAIEKRINALTEAYCKQQAA